MLLFYLLLTSCSSNPKADQYYEHRGTRERVKIEYVSDGKKAAAFCQQLADDLNSVFMKSRGISPFKLRYNDADSTKECVVFFEQGDITRVVLLTYYNVVPVEQFLVDYKLVE